MKRLRDDVSIERLNRIGHEYRPGFLGVDMIELTEGALRRRMPVKKRQVAPTEFLQAARLVALADTTGGYATVAHLPDGAQSFTTIELKRNHLGTVREGSIVGRPRSIWGERRHCGTPWSRTR